MEASTVRHVPRSRAHETHQAMRADILAALEPLLFEPLTLNRVAEVNGRLEADFAAFTGQRYACAVASGTAALFLALRAVGVGPGDEVITVANSDISTTGAVSHCGAVPVVADVLADDYTIDPSLVEALITPRTRALLPVDMHGHPSNARALRDIADRHGLRIVEDAALAAGATDYGQHVGAFADATIFSFAPFKPLGCLGNGGIVTTNDPQVAHQLRLLSRYGYDPDHEAAKTARQMYVAEGYNVPLDPLQAALVTLKLPYLAEWTTRRRAVVDRYAAGLADTAAILPRFRPESRPTFRSYTVRVPDQARALREMRAAGVEVVLHYTPAIHHQPLYHGRLPGSDRLPVTEQLAGEILSLPVAPELTDDDIDYAIAALRDILDRGP